MAGWRRSAGLCASEIDGRGSSIETVEGEVEAARDYEFHHYTDPGLRHICGTGCRYLMAQ
jgi:hypothetical protein